MAVPLQLIVSCCAEVFILVNYLYLVIVDDSIRLGWRVFPKINAHVFWFLLRSDTNTIAKVFNTGPRPTTSLDNRLSKAVSSQNLIKYLFGRMFLQSFVYKMNKRGDKTHPWGDPVETTVTLEVVLFIRTCWGLPTKKIKHP